MNDVLSLLKALNRPRLLISAARHGLGDFRRDTYLRRTLKLGALPGHGEVVLRLMELESDMEEARREKCARYNALRHIEVLMALMTEARLLAARSLKFQENASPIPEFLRAV